MAEKRKPTTFTSDGGGMFFFRNEILLIKTKLEKSYPRQRYKKNFTNNRRKLCKLKIFLLPLRKD